MKRIRIPTPKKLPKWKQTKPGSVKEQSSPPKDNIVGNSDIDVNKLAMLINVCHLVANVNWLFVIDINDKIGKADPALHKLFEHPISRIKEHASAMLSIIDDKMGEEFSEGFEQLTDDLKQIIHEYVKGKRDIGR